MTTAFELQFRPSAALIQVVRRFVSDFYVGVLDDPDAVARVALATHELLENAVKYSMDGTTELSIDVEPGPEGTREIAIRLRNRAATCDIEALRGLFEEMERFPDPCAQYQVAMERGARRRTGSGLGIVRVRAEGEMRMRCSVEGDRVLIEARTQVGPRGQA
ncbi:hypothetical protein [Chondromyces crocatus]|uniref:Histidine kinase/HSP90-like ATPase domain-containing protein n=1 Tax=Chondromyces crocatus TaxID=52 RepID=A0A0K1E8I4_CHOCO|nr:hypothetical protein [Chondromyces crocatus]AKT36893.1 uncharacterized protein CMC5_010140 [Chondromyces crocatus]